MTSSKSSASLFTYFSQNPHDVVVTPHTDDNVTPHTGYEENETGMDRLKQVFMLDKQGYPSPEISMLSQFTFLSTLGGFVFGGIMESRLTFLNFIKNNDATKFLSHLDAKQKLQRVMFLSFMKGGAKLGWRVGAFSFLYTSLLTASAVYRGRETLLGYVGSGALTGALVKMNMGPKGMLAGSILGGFLGTIGGALSLAALNVSGLSMTDIKNLSKKMADARQDAIKESCKEQMKEELLNITEMNESQE